MEWRKHFLLVLWMVIALAAGSFDAAWAAETGYFRNYGQVRLGLNEFKGDFEDAGYDTGGNLSVAYGRYLNRYLVLEAALDFFGTEHDIHGSTPTAGSYKREDTIGVMAFLATVKGEWPAGPLTIFGGGGAGLYLLALDSEITTANIGDFDEDESDSVFGLHIVTGVNYDITNRFFAGVQGLYRWTDDIDIRKSVGTVPVRVEGNLNGYTVTLTGGFRF